MSNTSEGEAGSPIDQKKILTSLTERAIDGVISRVSSTIVGVWSSQRIFFTSAFSTYLERKTDSLSSVRNLVFDTVNARFEDVYVPQQLENGPSTISEEELFLFLNDTYDAKDRRPTNAALVRASAGYGKTFLMRKTFLMFARSESSYVPLYIELRQLNRVPLTNFPAAIAADFHSVGIDIPLAYITEGLKAGLFAVILDGFDEINHPAQDHYSQELRSFCATYGNCPVIVSGRPDPQLLAWAHLTMFDVAPLDLKRCRALVSKQTAIRPGARREFSRMLKTSLFNERREFLEVPLLATIMLLTYASSGKISSTHIEFYEDMFTALWERHDARKEYNRRRYTDLSRDDFRYLLSAFCYSAYMNGHFDFDDKRFGKHFNNAVSITGLSVSKGRFWQDLVTATCLLMQDGTEARFSHRSFQEYFVAHFATTRERDVFTKLVNVAITRYGTDLLLRLIQGIDAEKLERLWVLPQLDPIMTKLEEQREAETGRWPHSFWSDYPDMMGIAKSRDASGEDRSRFLQHIRTIFDFLPTSDELLAEYDAKVAMRQFSEIGNGFEEDYENFRRLWDRLRSQFSTADDAVLEIAGLTKR